MWLLSIGSCQQNRKNAQKRFNSSIRQGESHANNLGSKIMSYVGAYAGMQGIGKVVGTSDKVVQITARLNVMPGDNVTMEVELIAPIAVENGTEFSIREGGRTVGAGTVTEIIE